MKSVFIETYGCQMNISDTEIVQTILVDSGYKIAENIDSADIILLNTCSVRENAERKIIERLKVLKKKYNQNSKDLKVGIIGCMAERIKEKLAEKHDVVSIIVGPDEYRKLPEILQINEPGIKAVAVNLSNFETYDDILPTRQSKLCAYISIMRGCNNYCSYCVVPYTRGRERSRSAESILNEFKLIIEKGYKEITLLGQNVNSYFDEVSKYDFPELLTNCARFAEGIRIRFITSHPKDLSSKLIDVIAKNDNICKHIHLPVQSGSDRILNLMNRKYSKNKYLELIDKLREKIPNIAITTDIIAGFPSETIDDHNDTLDLMQKVRFDGAFMFKYSPREGTKAYKYLDDVAENEKIRRLNEIITLQQNISNDINQKEIGKIYPVLVEGISKRSSSEWKGRTDTNKTVIFPDNKKQNIYEGIILRILITNATSASLKGKIIT